MNSYNHKIGTYNERTGFLSHFGTKLVALGMGGFLGFYMGAMVVVAQVEGSVQPLTITYGNDTSDDRNELPIVHALQQNGSLRMGSTVSSPDDLQPASGYNVIQRTERVQP